MTKKRYQMTSIIRFQWCLKKRVLKILNFIIPKIAIISGYVNNFKFSFIIP